MSEISVVVTGSTSIASTVGNGDSVSVNVGDQTIGGGNGAAATVQVGTVTTLGATSSASVVNSGTSYAAKLDFGIPRGSTGSTGPANSLSIGSVSTGATAAVSISGTAPSQTLSFVLQPGPQGSTGPANSLSIGSVSTGATAAVSISGTAPSQSLSFVLPQGPAGPANSLSVGSVSTGATASVSISGSAPSQTLAFVLQPGPAGPYTTLKIGTVTAVSSTSNAAITTSSSGSTTTLNFSIPRGETGSVNLADETPQPLGTASAGSALAAARADHVHSIPTISYTALSNVPASFTPASHTQTISSIDGLQVALDAKQATGTYCVLVNSLVPSANLPSYVDDVIDVGGTLPASGDVGKIYVVSAGGNTNKIYRWSGSAFIEISPSPGSTDSVTEGSVNLYFTDARAVSALSSSLATKASTSHTHSASQVTDFSTEVAKIGNVVSVNGQTGVVTISTGSSLSLSDATPSALGVALAGTGTAASRSDHVHLLPTISYTALSNVPTSFTPASHTHSATDIASGILNAARLPTISYTALSNVPTSFTPAAHTQSASTITDLTAVANVISVNGMTGAVTIATGGTGSSSYTLPNATTSSLGGVVVGTGLSVSSGTISANVISVNGMTGAVTIATGGTGSSSYTLPNATTSSLGGVVVGTGLSISSGTISANVVSVQGRTGSVTVSATDLTAVTSITTGTTATAVLNVIALSSAAYSAISVKSTTTLYIVSG
jgi:hypothetical protein